MTPDTMRRIITSVVVVLLLVARWYLDAPEAVAQEATICEQWNTEGFFRTATASTFPCRMRDAATDRRHKP